MAEENHVFVQWMLPRILNNLHVHISKGKFTIRLLFIVIKH